MDPRFPPLAPQSPPRKGGATRAAIALPLPLPLLPLGEWLVFGSFVLLLALA